MKNFSKNFEIIYHPLLENGSFFIDILNSDKEYDFLIVEGSFSKDDTLIDRFGIPFSKIIDNLSNRAKYIICAGSCASFGGIFRLRDTKNITGALYSGKDKGGYWSSNSKVINIPGCPLHPNWIVDTLFLLKNKKKLLLDEFLRPKEIFSYFVHHGCMRNEYFEWKVDSKNYGEKRGFQ